MPETFEKFLEEKCFEEYPQTLDDDMEDVFDRFLSNLSVGELLDYAEEMLVIAKKNIIKPVSSF